MFGSLGRRAVETVVGLFALLGFAYVPLGAKSGLEHALALLATPPAKEAAAGLLFAAQKARILLVQALTGPAPDSAPLPLPSARPSGARGVRPVAPRLPK